jgi:hypothetical protein
MTKPIEELERELDEAVEAERAARGVRMAAQEALQQARNEASGIIGHVLEYTMVQHGQKRKEITRRLLVERVETGWGNTLSAYGKLVVANGTIGIRRDRVVIERAKDLGPYQPPTA